MQTHFANFVKDLQRGPGWEEWPQVGILGVADGNAVTTTQDVRELDPICQEYNRLWLATEVPTLAQAQPSSEESGEDDVPSMATRSFPSIEISVVGGAILFAAALL